MANTLRDFNKAQIWPAGKVAIQLFLESDIFMIKLLIMNLKFGNILFLFFLTIATLTLNAQKTVYKASFVTAHSKYSIKFGPDNRFREEDPRTPTEYSIYDLVRNGIFTVYTKLNKYQKGPLGIYKINDVSPIQEEGDTIISGYHCKKYIVKADAAKDGINVILHDTYTYYTTTELSYPHPFIPFLFRNDYLPCVKLNGFLIKMVRSETIDEKKKKKTEEKPSVDTYYYTDFSFSKVSEDEIALPFKE